jgi:hypothetical protein
MEEKLPCRYKILLHTTLAQANGHVGFFSIHVCNSPWDGPNPVFTELVDQGLATSSIVVAMRAAHLRAWEWINSR